MFSSALRSAPRRVLASRLPLRPSTSSRFLSTAPPSQKSRSWKGTAARWAIAVAGVYYYNTSSVFAEQPDGAIARLDESIHHIQESNLPTVDAIVEEKHRRQAERQEQEAKASQSQAVHETPGSAADEEEIGSVGDLEEEADQQGAFNPETGEINWDCPCLGGMAHGPCGPEFREAFSCFVHSTEDPKGMECIEKFKGMQDCFRQHPEMYGSELEDDEDELEEELRADASVRSAEEPSQIPSTSDDQPQISKAEPVKHADEVKDLEVVEARETAPPVTTNDEDGLVTKAAFDATTK